MASSDRSALRRRLAWFAGSLLLLAALAAAFWFGRPAPSPPAPEPIAEAPPAPPPEAPPRDELGLAELSAAVADALQPPLQGRPTSAPIMGRKFAVTVPFGCAGPLAEGAQAPLGYTYDPTQQAITLTARPEAWSDSALVEAVSQPGEYEAVEGFWIAPAAVYGCAPPPEPHANPPAGPRVGLARFFPAGASRAAQRRERPYRVTRKIEGPAPSFPRGFRLVLSGRVADGQAGPAIRCGAAASLQAPECLIAVEFDRVAFEDVATGEVLAAWEG